jgi:hypothetical protein
MQDIEPTTAPTAEKLPDINIKSCGNCLYFSQGQKAVNEKRHLLYFRGNCQESSLESEHHPTVSIAGKQCELYKAKNNEAINL